MPEERREIEVPGADEQMRLLLEELGGHPSLARLRGRLGGSAISMVAALAEEGRPTQAKLSARDLGSDLAWAARLLAKLKRDGREVAASELENVLTWPNYMMLGDGVHVSSSPDDGADALAQFLGLGERSVARSGPRVSRTQRRFEAGAGCTPGRR